MRLRVMQDILKEYKDDLIVTFSSVNNQFEITNYPHLYLTLKEVTKFKFLSNEKSLLENTIIFSNKNKRVIVDTSSLNEFRSIVEKIRLKVNTVIDAINEAIPEQDENSISIKLPDYANLENVSKFIKEINNILNQSLVGKYQGTIKLQNFDTGSNWIEVVLNNADAIIYFGYIYRTATQIFREEYLNWKRGKHTIQSLNVDSKAKEAVLKALEDEIETKARLNAKMLMENAEITDNQNEYHTNLTKSIIKLAEFISEGSEVHTALNAPEPAREAFPEPEEIKNLVESTIGLLTDGQDEENTTVEEDDDSSNEQ